jgi:IS605 OrfB family transposase
MIRTVKWLSWTLNVGKWLGLVAVALAYSHQKDAFLRDLAKTSRWADLDKPRKFRNRDKKTRVNVWRLPVHLYDRALSDAVDTMRRWILSAIATAHIRGKVFASDKLSAEQKHYGFWILRSFERIGAVLRGEAPSPKFQISPQECQAVVRLLRRLLRQALGHPPRVHLRRSFELDSSLYRFFVHKGVAFLAVASLKPGERIVIPLRGLPAKAVTGNVRVVLHPARRTVAVHQPIPVRVPVTGAATASVTGLDAGVTEVFTRDDGAVFGTGFGAVLTRLTEETTAQGAARNRAHALAKALRASGHPADRRKAARILRFNLGQKKLDARADRGKAEVRRQISEAVNGVLGDHPGVVVVEDLSHLRGRTKSRKLSRKVSRWMRQSLGERLEFKIQAGGSRQAIVNAAYTSQTCPACGWVDKENRHGDRLRCVRCHFTAPADQVAAVNVKRRYTDPELRERIQPFTPKEQVKAILVEIYERNQARTLVTA